jgi:uncharacterized OsmC-like protein
VTATSESAAQAARLNGLDVADLQEYVSSIEENVRIGDRDPIVVGKWVGGTRSELSSPLGGPVVYMGGRDDASAMGMLMRALAACDIEVIVTRATLLGIEIEDLTVEARGHFNIAPYLGVDRGNGAGLKQVSYVVKLRTAAPLTAEQEAVLKDAVAASPVANTFERHVTLACQLELA